MPDQADSQPADLLELRVGLASVAAEMTLMRQALAPLAGMPLQLDALAQLQAERLTNHIANHARDVSDLHADLEAEAARRRASTEALERRDDALERRLGKDIDSLREWQTWAMRLVLGLVVAAIVTAVLVTP